jgi:hypothetical protein
MGQPRGDGKSPEVSVMATQKNVAKKAPAKKKTTTRSKSAPRKKAPARKAEEFTLRDRAQKGVNIYLGLWGAGYDLLQENLEFARSNKLRTKELEKRGEKLRKELRKNLDKFELRELDQVFDGVQGQLDKLQKKLDELEKDLRSRIKPVGKAA